jgi:hypothetical protein
VARNIIDGTVYVPPSGDDGKADWIAFLAIEDLPEEAAE